MRGRGPSNVPAKAVEAALEVKPENEQAEMRLSNLTHRAYGTAWGIPRGLLASVGLTEPKASACTSVWSGAQRWHRCSLITFQSMGKEDRDDSCESCCCEKHCCGNC